MISPRRWRLFVEFMADETRGPWPAPSSRWVAKDRCRRRRWLACRRQCCVSYRRFRRWALCAAARE